MLVENSVDVMTLSKHMTQSSAKHKYIIGLRLNIMQDIALYVLATGMIFLTLDYGEVQKP